MLPQKPSPCAAALLSPGCVIVTAPQLPHGFSLPLFSPPPLPPPPPPTCFQLYNHVPEEVAVRLPFPFRHACPLPIPSSSTPPPNTTRLPLHDVRAPPSLSLFPFPLLFLSFSHSSTGGGQVPSLVALFFPPIHPPPHPQPLPSTVQHHTPCAVSTVAFLCLLSLPLPVAVSCFPSFFRYLLRM